MFDEQSISAGTVLGICMLPYFILLKTLEVIIFYPHFIDEETEAQK